MWYLPLVVPRRSTRVGLKEVRVAWTGCGGWVDDAKSVGVLTGGLSWGMNQLGLVVGSLSLYLSLSPPPFFFSLYLSICFSLTTPLPIYLSASLCVPSLSLSLCVSISLCLCLFQFLFLSPFPILPFIFSFL